jgi:hypothetical protein
MSSIAMEICPMCAMCPTLAGRWRLQVRCSCGACGPKMKTQDEAIGRWNSVANFIREFMRTGVVVAADALESGRRPAGVRRLMRRLAWQCGLEPHQGL